MLRLRPYKKCDAQHIVAWIRDEHSFYQWSADRYNRYPITAEDMNDHYEAFAYADNFYPMTAFDENGVAGHLIMRFTDEEKRRLRFGFIIVDSSRRGQGLGKAMLTLARKYAFEILGAESISLGVFSNNPSAHYCYEAAGFRDIGHSEQVEINGESWECVEMEVIR